MIRLFCVSCIHLLSDLLEVSSLYWSLVIFFFYIYCVYWKMIKILMGRYWMIVYRDHSKKFRPEDMEVRLDGKNCVVTGANSGIGYATAEGLASRYADYIDFPRMVLSIFLLNNKVVSCLVGMCKSFSLSVVQMFLWCVVVLREEKLRALKSVQQPVTIMCFWR